LPRWNQESWKAEWSRNWEKLLVRASASVWEEEEYIEGNHYYHRTKNE
jgi:hypothetical protein